MTDERSWSPHLPLPATKPRPAELLFEFVRADHVHFRCELRYHGEWGVEAQFLREGELEIGRRFDSRELAVQWAEQERPFIEKGGA